MPNASSRLTAPPFLVTITGGSGSGKTTLANALADRLGRNRVSIVPQDAYYRDQTDLPPPDRETLNYDAPQAFDNSLFLNHLRALRSGLPVSMPAYSFESHTRLPHTHLVHPQEIILVDGLLLLYDPAIREQFDLRIFLEVETGVRLARRIQRDVGERGRTVPGVLTQFLHTVLPAHQHYVEPTKMFADLVLSNTSRLEECVEPALNAIMTRLHQHASRAVHTINRQPQDA